MAEEDIYILTKVTTYTSSASSVSSTPITWGWCDLCGVLCVILFLAFVGWGLYAIIEAFTPQHNYG